jgi:histidyl-tRNA synthetase
MQAIQKLRNQNIKAELYPDAAKMDKQFKHAEKRGIPFVVKEITGDLFTLKDIVSGAQTQITFAELLQKLE